MVLVKFGVYNIIQRLLIKRWLILLNSEKMSLIEKRNIFKNEEEVNNHINFIEEEIKISEKDSRMLEIRNWLNLIN